jgi:hypothetical protein
MVSKKPNEQSLDELVETVKQISLLIEDNNQNIKDCYRTLKQIQEKVSPAPVSLSRRIRLAICKLLNIK